MAVSAVLGCGRSLPPRVVTSEELGSELRLGGKVVAERSGVVRRNYAGPGIGPSDLGREAALGTRLGNFQPRLWVIADDETSHELPPLRSNLLIL